MATDMDVCPNRGKFWTGCNFEGRYDTKNPPAETLEVVLADGFCDLEDVLDQMQESTYVRDICTTCGKVVERQG